MTKDSDRSVATSGTTIPNRRSSLRARVLAGIILMTMVALGWAIRLPFGSAPPINSRAHGPIEKALSVGEDTTTAMTPLRSGPGSTYTILRVMPEGTSINVSNTVRNGFRYVVHEGLAGWIPDQHPGARTGT